MARANLLKHGPAVARGALSAGMRSKGDYLSEMPSPDLSRHRSKSSSTCTRRVAQAVLGMDRTDCLNSAAVPASKAGFMSGSCRPVPAPLTQDVSNSSSMPLKTPTSRTPMASPGLKGLIAKALKSPLWSPGSSSSRRRMLSSSDIDHEFEDLFKHQNARATQELCDIAGNAFNDFVQTEKLSSCLRSCQPVEDMERLQSIEEMRDESMHHSCKMARFTTLGHANFDTTASTVQAKLKQLGQMQKRLSV